MGQSAINGRFQWLFVSLYTMLVYQRVGIRNYHGQVPRPHGCRFNPQLAGEGFSLGWALPVVTRGGESNEHIHLRGIFMVMFDCQRVSIPIWLLTFRRFLKFLTEIHFLRTIPYSK